MLEIIENTWEKLFHRTGGVTLDRVWKGVGGLNNLPYVRIL